MKIQDGSRKVFLHVGNGAKARTRPVPFQLALRRHPARAAFKPLLAPICPPNRARIGGQNSVLARLDHPALPGRLDFRVPNRSALNFRARWNRPPVADGPQNLNNRLDKPGS